MGELVSAPPHLKVYDRVLAQSTSLQDALGDNGGILRIRPRSLSCNMHSSVSMGHNMVVTPSFCYDSVEIVRLHNEVMGSPIVLVKNFNCDRGFAMAHAAGIRATVENAPEAKKEIKNNVRSTLVDMAKPFKTNTSSFGLHKASNCVMDIADGAVRHDALAVAALRHQTPFTSTATLIYDKNTTLPRHVDHCGNWVVLYSFGCSVDFYAGCKSVRFESGDVLVF